MLEERLGETSEEWLIPYITTMKNNLSILWGKAQPLRIWLKWFLPQPVRRPFRLLYKVGRYFPHQWHRVTQSPSDPRPTVTSDFRPYMPSFMMPMNGYDQPYRTPTSMTKGLHTTASTFADYTANTFLLTKASGSLKNNSGRTTQPLGMGFSFQVMLTFNTNSVMVMREKMDECNHDMVNLFSRQMS